MIIAGLIIIDAPDSTLTQIIIILKHYFLACWKIFLYLSATQCMHLLGLPVYNGNYYKSRRGLKMMSDMMFSYIRLVPVRCTLWTTAAQTKEAVMLLLCSMGKD